MTQAPPPPSPRDSSSSTPADDVATSEIAESVRDWVRAWGDEVASVDLPAGRRRFRSDVVAFGTHADIVRGLDALHDRQWSQVWPNITGFRFLVDDMVTLPSADGLHAVAVVGWTSIGYDRSGEPFDRPGRATIVLERPDHRTGWTCSHTHFSLARDVPPTTHGLTGAGKADGAGGADGAGT